MGIQVKAKDAEFTRKGGKIETVTNTKWVWVEEIQDEVQEEVEKRLYHFPSGLRATSYSPTALVFDMRPNKPFVDELTAMGVSFIQI